MYRTRLGIAGATLATCAFLGSLGAAQPALAAPADASDIESITASAATLPAIPLEPRHGGPTQRGAAVSIFTVDESAKRLGSDGIDRVLTLAGYASASDGAAASGVIAAVDMPARHSNVIEHRAARAPPTA